MSEQDKPNAAPPGIVQITRLGRPAVAAVHSQAATAAIAQQPAADALGCYARGVALRKNGSLDAALASYDEALALAPDFVKAWRNRGNVLLKLNRQAEALASYGRALALDPGQPETLNNRAIALKALGRVTEALDSYDRALALNPDYPQAWNNRGNLLKDLGRLPEALASIDRALALRPEYVEAWNNRGAVLNGLNRVPEALESFDRALALQPDYADAWSNRGLVLNDTGRPAEALENCDQALAHRSDHAEALSNRANALRNLGRLEEALDCYERAIAARPDYPQAWSNRGNLLKAFGRTEEALESFDRALALHPDYAEAWNNRGAVLNSLGRRGEALECYVRALALWPDYAEAHWNEGLCRLLLGDYATGWEKYGWRWKSGNFGLYKPVLPQPEWRGETDLAGKTVLLCAEQGYGDTLQFVRYAPQVKALGATVLLQAPAPLVSLLSGMEGVDRVVANGSRLPRFDYFCPLLSLPHILRTRLHNIPAPRAYLRADPGKAAGWRTRLDGVAAPRIGLAWSGNTAHSDDRNRSLPLRLLAEALQSGRGYVCLQKELRADDSPALLDRLGMTFFGEALQDFTDTAALLQNMDLVITVDTSVAHLAGAMGLPVWILLPFAPDWRWLLERRDSPWYPSARLFRQPAPGDWASVVHEVDRELAAIDQSVSR